ncbi:acyl-CoA carboxylase subunit beta [Natrinema halophilum]|uniref:acyl-CoA carboxylase subunit beta n=1 Tax=Natrinema halophilum TaxID=1699371 RepID=UPI001F1B7243|nr:acyl-CoA carboxylase subunit beta [Natrinema halophilum]UHQ96313.1 acyl-CoA carboxylase subunit beta [Natrinema halophilum]
MEISIDDTVTSDEAIAIVTAVANHFGHSIELVDTTSDETVVTAEPGDDGPAETGDDGPTDEEIQTERERRVVEAIDDILTGGPERGHEKIEQLGKLFVRERLDLIFDEINWEDGTFARYDSDDRLPADGIVTGSGTIDGRTVFFIANDYTVKAGTRSTMSTEKQLRIQERAEEVGAPILFLVDSAGARITDQSGLFADRYRGGKTFFNQARSSGNIPQIGVLYGPCVAGAAYTPVFCDFLMMVDQMSAMSIASPRMIEQVTGEETTLQNLGGPDIHATESGSVDLVVDDEFEAADRIRDVISYLPQNHTELPPKTSPSQPSTNPSRTNSVIPANPNTPYDVHELIDCVIDDNSWLEFKPTFASELVTGFGRIDGRPVGVLANQPNTRSGAIYPDSSEKAAGFIWKCDAFNIPLVYLCDTPGFMVGRQVESEGILQKGRKFIYATSNATVPRFCVVVRKAYGAGIFAMSGPAFEPDSTIALPSAEIAVMGPKAAIHAVYANQIEEIDDPKERQQFIEDKREEYRQDIDIFKLSSKMAIDELIPAARLRKQLAARLETYETKPSPDQKHGSILF